VEASVRFGGGGDRIGIILDNGDTCRAVVMMVPGPTQLNLTPPLPYSAAVGNIITNYSAVPAAEVD
jgi:hypothetical protein